MPVLGIDLVQANQPDEMVRLLDDDAQSHIGGAFADLVDEGLLALLVHGAVHTQGARHFRIVDPGHDRRGVGALEGAQVDLLAD